MPKTNNRCIIPGCRSKHQEGNEKENGIGFFRVPKASFEDWKIKMPHIMLTEKSRVCIRHFEPNDVIKGFVINNTFHPHQRWQIKKGAYPKRYLEPEKPPLKGILQDTFSKSSKNLDPYKGTSSNGCKLKRKPDASGIDNVNQSKRKSAKVDSIAIPSNDKTVHQEELTSNSTNPVFEPTSTQNCSITANNFSCNGDEFSCTETNVPTLVNNNVDDLSSKTISELQDICVPPSIATMETTSESLILDSCTDELSMLQQHSNDLSTAIPENDYEESFSQNADVADTAVNEGIDSVQEEVRFDSTNPVFEPIIPQTRSIFIENSLSGSENESRSDGTGVSQAINHSMHVSSEINSELREIAVPPSPGILDSDSSVGSVRSSKDCNQNESNQVNEEANSNFVTNYGNFRSLTILVEVPENWVWTYEENIITCSNLKKLPNKTLLLKAVEVLNKQALLYHMNGKICKSMDLPKTFTSIEDLSLILRDFARRKSCKGFYRKDVNTVVRTEKLSSKFCYDGQRYWSKHCWNWASNQDLCSPCRSLKRYIFKRLRQPLNQNSCKTKTRQQFQSVLDNSRRKITSLKSNLSDTHEMVKQLRENCQKLVVKEQRNSLDNLLVNLSPMVNNRI